MKKVLVFAVALMSLSLTACGGGSASPEPAVVVAFGDSLTANNAMFVTPSVHWVELLKAQIKANGLDAKRSVTVINEGIGGEDSTAALARLPAVLVNDKPTHIILTHGTNDLPPYCLDCPAAITQVNLEAMAELAKKAGVKVIMGEFTLRAYGTPMAQAYTKAYQAAALNSKTTYANLVQGIPFDGNYYQPDGIHFTDAAQDALKNNVAAALFPML